MSSSEETNTRTAAQSELRERVVAALKRVHDPEIPVNVWDLGLIYDLDVREDGEVRVEMTLTAPACPVADSLPPFIESELRNLDGVERAKVELVWEPKWTPERMSEAARLQLGML